MTSLGGQGACPMNVSERLTQENTILREIRLTLSTFRSVSPGGGTRRKGAVYASSPITSGLMLFNLMIELGIKSPDELKSAHPLRFKTDVLDKNLANGEIFGRSLQNKGFAIVIVPSQFFAKGWAQEHYMSLWRQVIIRHARTVALNTNWQWSTGCVEEFLIGLQNRKRIVYQTGEVVDEPRKAADLILNSMREIDSWGFESKPLYDLWRQIVLTIDGLEDKGHSSHASA